MLKNNKSRKNNRFLKNGGSIGEPQPSEDALLHEIMYYRNQANIDDYEPYDTSSSQSGPSTLPTVVNNYYAHAADLISQYKLLNYNERKLKAAYDIPLLRAYSNSLKRDYELIKSKHWPWLQNMSARKATNDAELAAFNDKIARITNTEDLQSELAELVYPDYIWHTEENFMRVSSMTKLYNSKKQLIESRLQLLQRPVTPPAVKPVSPTRKSKNNRSPRKTKHSSSSSSSSSDRTPKADSVAAQRESIMNELRFELESLKSQLEYAKQDVIRLEQQVSAVQRDLDSQ